MIKATEVAIKASENKMERQQELTDKFSEGKVEGITKMLLKED
jgi:hypothetical protein